MGTMLGTAGLFFASGIVLGLVAFLIIRIEKRMNAAPAAKEPHHDDRQQDHSRRAGRGARPDRLPRLDHRRPRRVLRDGREITLKVEPVDPRDLLRGDYVSLCYEISRIPVSQITNLPPEAVSGAPRARSMSG